MRSGMVARLCSINWHAIRLYRWSHRLHARGHPTLALVVATLNRVLTGVEIWPAAQIGARLQIMHGHGIVVGGAATVGDDCIIFQQVTLGVREFRRDGSVVPGPTQPRIGDRVIIYAGAKIIGPVVIGDGAQIGANAVVIRDVPPGAVAVGVPARLVGGRTAD